jgi:pimeloyl-ACP methyl ester carboxylesterase
MRASMRPEHPSDPPSRRIALPRGPASYTEEGEGERVVVAVHGMPGSVRDFRWLGPALAPHLRFLRVDLPGFGETPAELAPGLTPLDRARFVIDFLAALDLRGPRRPVLLGHSMGSVITCAVAHLAPEAVRGIALLSSPGLRPHRTLRNQPLRPMAALLSRPFLARRLLPFLRKGFVRSGFRGPYPDDVLLRTIQSVAQIDLPAHAARVRTLPKIPCLVAWSHDDPLIEDEISEELARALPEGPRLRFADGGHNPQKAHAVEIAAGIAAWFDTLAGP